MKHICPQYLSIHFSTLLVITLLFSCKKEDCEDEPFLPNLNETFQVEFKNSLGNSIFDKTYDIDKLLVYENTNTLNHSYDSSSNLVSFIPQTFLADNISNTLNRVVYTNFIFKFSPTDSTALNFESKVIVNPDGGCLPNYIYKYGYASTNGKSFLIVNNSYYLLSNGPLLVQL